MSKTGAGSNGALQHLLASHSRDYLIRSNGVQVPIKSLSGYKVGIYLWASWSRSCRKFTQQLVETYNDLSSKGEFEIVCISKDIDEKLFQTFFSKMPWLAIPFSDYKAHKELASFFCYRLPHLVIFDEKGSITSHCAVDMVQEYGADAYPFTCERIKEIEEKEDESKRNQSLRSLLVSSSRNFVLSADGERVCVSKLEWKFIGLYFCSSSDNNCKRFTPKLVKVYDLLKQGGANFEIVTVSFSLEDKQDDDMDDDVNEDEGFGCDQLKMPWLKVPFKDHKSRAGLVRYFKIRFSDLPKLVIIGAYGETLEENAVDAIEDYGAEAFPFRKSKLDELKEKETVRLKALNLVNIFGKVPWYNHLIGKHILLYISGKADTPKAHALGQLVGLYREIVKRGDVNDLKIVYIPNEEDLETSLYDFIEFELTLVIVPAREDQSWIASTRCLFKVDAEFEGKMVVIGPNGKVITRQGMSLLMSFGGCIYPFTEERLGEMVKEWPETMNDTSLHKHEVKFIKIDKYKCGLCGKVGLVWAFSCQYNKCSFNCHPKCAKDKTEQAKCL